ncbi:hypothetical protein F5I97DRAFT_1808679 [Phlebopus sp. FC_14]|nr:hypothetical protein F5I97DRAFT_1808679 [Phlebopus sp. FC_14]
MDVHAQAILEVAESWEWPVVARLQATGEQAGKFKAVTSKLLSGFIKESHGLGGSLLDHFWDVVGGCHPQLAENEKLRNMVFVSKQDSEQVLFEGINREEVNFGPIFTMAAELFTHLGVAFMNSGGRRSGSGTSYSVTDIMSKATDELLMSAKKEGLGQWKQAALKELVLRRDGHSCPLTHATFDGDGVDPILAHIIPNSVHDKPDTLKCIAMFAGTAARDCVMQQSNDVGNLMTTQSDAHTAYDNLKWGIEAQTHGESVKYIYRRVPAPDTPAPGPGYIRLRDGDEILFGRGPDGMKLGLGPDPLLCNLQLAVARVLKMSAAAELIMEMKDDADDSDYPHVYIASDAFCDILTAKLLLSGRAPLM